MTTDGSAGAEQSTSTTRGTRAWTPRNGELDYDPFREGNEEIERERAQCAETIRKLTERPQPSWPQPFPGVMADTVAAILAVAPKPRAVVSMLAVFAGMSASLSGRWRLPNGMRMNQNICVVIPTGGGKDLPRVVSEQIAQAAGAQVGGKPASGAAVEQELEPYGAKLISIDEAAHMIAVSTGRNAQHYMKDAQAVKLKTYTDSKGNYLVRGYADPKRRTKPQDRVIPHPCVVWASYSTVEMLAAAMGSEHVVSGDLPRDLIVVDTVVVDQRRVRHAFTMPQAVTHRIEELRRASDWSQRVPAGGIEADRFVTVTIEPDADAELDNVMQRANEVAKQTEGFAFDINTRHYEKVERVAGVLACWTCPDNPRMSADMVRWADELVIASDVCAVSFFGTEVHDDRRMQLVERARKAIVSALQGKGGPNDAERELVAAGKAPWSPALRLFKLGAEEFHKAVEHLQSAGEVTVDAVGVGKQREVKAFTPTQAWRQ